MIEHLASNRWSSRPANATYVDRFLSLAESRGISVYWLLAPSCPDLERRRDLAGDEVKFRAYVRSVEAKHPTLTVLDGRDPGWDDSVFVDSTHLGPRGAVAMTKAVATALRSSAAPWTRIRNGPVTEPLPENVDQSRLVLERGGAVLR